MGGVSAYYGTAACGITTALDCRKPVLCQSSLRHILSSRRCRHCWLFMKLLFSFIKISTTWPKLSSGFEAAGAKSTQPKLSQKAHRSCSRTILTKAKARLSSDKAEPKQPIARYKSGVTGVPPSTFTAQRGFCTAPVSNETRPQSI